MKTHNLKTDKEVFNLSWHEEKPFEIRCDDRHFNVGEELVLYETEFTGEEMKNGKPLIFTGRRIRQHILSKIKGEYGILPDFCVMGVEELHRENTPVTWDIQNES